MLKPRGQSQMSEKPVVFNYENYLKLVEENEKLKTENAMLKKMKLVNLSDKPFTSFALAAELSETQSRLAKVTVQCDAAIRAREEAKKNNPPTLEELLKMDGAPIWVDDLYMDFHGWMLSQEASDYLEGCDVARCNGVGLIFSFKRDVMGHGGVLLTYSHKPKEVDHSSVKQRRSKD